MKSELFAAWLLTLALHAVVMLAIAWLADRRLLRSHLGWREWIWRIALFGGLISASGQMLLDTPKAARIATTPTIEAEHPVAHSTPAVQRQEPDLRSTTSVSTTFQARSVMHPSPAESIAPANAGSPFMIAMPTWVQMLVVMWLAGAMLAFARIGRAWKQMRRTLVDADTLSDDSIREVAAELARQAGIAAPRLLVLDDLASPAAFGGNRIVLPRWVLERLDRSRLRAMLAHEIAHLARRDPARKLAIASVCAVLWFVPLTTLARRRLDQIAEQSCDAWAARQCGDGRVLAECLYECAEHHSRGPQFEFAAAMSSRHSPVLQRINQLVDGVPMNLRVSLPRLLIASALTLAAALVLLPGIGVIEASAATDRPRPPVAPVPPTAPVAPSLPMPAAPAPPTAPVPVAAAAPAVAPTPTVAPVAPTPPPAPLHESGGGDQLHVSSESDGSGRRIDMRLGDDGHSYQAEIRGAVEFTDNYDGIASLARGATASFSETGDGVSRRVDYANRDGKLQRRYFVDDAEQPFDTTASQWIAKIVADMVRETALDADERVQQMLASGGVPAVLKEIGKIQSDYARGIYIKSLSAHGKLGLAEVTSVLGLIDPMNSDYERRNALAELGNAVRFDADQQKLVIGQAQKIDSDYERAELLLGLLPNLSPAEEVHDAWLQAANGFESDYEHRRTLTSLIEAGSNDGAILATVIDASRTIESGYERRELLTSAITAATSVDALAAAYVNAVDGIDGDYERREALMSLIHARGFGKASAMAVLNSAARVDSDYECREVLTALAAVMPNDSTVIARYREVARKLGDHERGEAESALDRFSS